MRKICNVALLVILVAFLVGLSGCLTEERRAEIVLNEENCEQFDDPHTSENFTTPYTLDIAGEIDELLADNELTRSDISDAFLVSASYEVLEFEQPHGWLLEGIITVERGGVVDTLLDYNDGVTVSDAIVGDKTYVKIHPAGAAMINQALDDFIAGDNPVLTITIENGNVDPDPSIGDPLDFVWEFCLFIQVITYLDTEIYDPL